MSPMKAPRRAPRRPPVCWTARLLPSPVRRRLRAMSIQTNMRLSQGAIFNAFGLARICRPQRKAQSRTSTLLRPSDTHADITATLLCIR